MSRGLGPLQLEILAAYERLVTTKTIGTLTFPVPVTRDALRTFLIQTHPAGASFEAAFSRALHTLCLRGHFLALTGEGQSQRYRGEHIRAVIAAERP